MGSRRGFICRMKVGNIAADNMAVGHLNRLKQRNSLGPSRDGQNYAVVHCTGYIKNWPPTGEICLQVSNVSEILETIITRNVHVHFCTWVTLDKHIWKGENTVYKASFTSLRFELFWNYQLQEFILAAFTGWWSIC